jgi:hypothetical protein
MSLNLTPNIKNSCKFDWINTKESAICQINSLTDYINESKIKLEKLETFIPALIDIITINHSKEAATYLGECISTKSRLLIQLPEAEEEIFILTKMLDSLPTKAEWEAANKASLIH